jgi:hypothetical protein
MPVFRPCRQSLSCTSGTAGVCGGALRDDDIDEGGAAEVHRFVEGAAQVLRVLDKEALAAKGFHHPVVTGAVDQRVRLHVEHRVFRDLGHAGAEALREEQALATGIVPAPSPRRSRSRSSASRRRHHAARDSSPPRRNWRTSGPLTLLSLVP